MMTIKDCAIIDKLMREGIIACRNGLVKSDCQYAPESAEEQCWLDGYDSYYAWCCSTYN